MAAAAKSTSQATQATDAKTRSLELALARGETNCSHRAKTLGWALSQDGALVSLALEISSATSDAVYAVGYDARRDDASCDCPAASYGRPCHHRGLAILCGREVARLYSPAGRAESVREYLADLRHEGPEGNATALAPPL